MKTTLILLLCAAFLAPSVVLSDHNAQVAAYVAKLKKQYKKQLRFSNKEAERLIFSSAIDCTPLVAHYARMKETGAPNSIMGFGAPSTFGLASKRVASDARHLPLLNLLYGRFLSQQEWTGCTLYTVVDARDGDVRIYDKVKCKEGEFRPLISMEIDKWGALSRNSARAISTSCFEEFNGKQLWIEVKAKSRKKAKAAQK